MAIRPWVLLFVFLERKIKMAMKVNELTVKYTLQAPEEVIPLHKFNWASVMKGATPFNKEDVMSNGAIKTDNFVKAVRGFNLGFGQGINYSQTPVDIVGNVIDAYTKGTCIMLAVKTAIDHGYRTVQEILESPAADERDIETARLIQLFKNAVFHGGGKGSYVSVPVWHTTTGQDKKAITLKAIQKIVRNGRAMDWNRLRNVYGFFHDFEGAKDYYAEISIDSTKVPPEFWACLLLSVFTRQVKVQYKAGEGEILIDWKKSEITNPFPRTGSYVEIHYLKGERGAETVANAGIVVFQRPTEDGRGMEYFYLKLHYEDPLQRVRDSVIKKVEEFAVNVMNLFKSERIAATSTLTAMQKRINTATDTAVAACRYAATFANRLSAKLVPIEQELEKAAEEAGKISKEARDERETQNKLLRSRLIEASTAETRHMAGASYNPAALGAALYNVCAANPESQKTLLRQFGPEKFVLAQYACDDAANHWSTDQVVSFTSEFKPVDGDVVQVVKRNVMKDGSVVGKLAEELPIDGDYELHSIDRETKAGTTVTEWFVCRQLITQVAIPVPTGRTTLFTCEFKLSDKARDTVDDVLLSMQYLQETLPGQKLAFEITGTGDREQYAPVYAGVDGDNKFLQLEFISGNAAYKRLKVTPFKVKNGNGFGSHDLLAERRHYDGRSGVVTACAIIPTYDWESKEPETESRINGYELIVLLENTEAPAPTFRTVASNPAWTFQMPDVSQLDVTKLEDALADEEAERGEMSDDEKAEFIKEYGDEFSYSSDDGEDFTEDYTQIHGDDKNSNSGSDDNEDFEKALEGLNVVSLDDFEETLKGLKVVSVEDLSQYV